MTIDVPRGVGFGPCFPVTRISLTGLLVGLVTTWGLLYSARAAEAPADLIVHGGKVVTVDDDFTIHDALAARDGRIIEVGPSERILRLRGDNTRVIDLAGKMVLPGLIDSHVHPNSACMTEFDHPVPTMESIDDVLTHVRERATVVTEGKWIVIRQVFLTRLREQRYPTKAELDSAAPKHPVAFITGPDASVNSLALELSGIDRNFVAGPTGNAKVEKDPVSGEPTGILRGAERYLKIVLPDSKATETDREQRLLSLFQDYLSWGLTSILDRDTSAEDLERYRKLHAQGRLPLRLRISRGLDATQGVHAVEAEIDRIAKDPLCVGDDRLKIIGVKTYLDGGMLTGSAYMREPWGISRIYSIDDPRYRGMRYIPPEVLTPIVRATLRARLQFTAHSVGDGAVDALLDAYEELDRESTVREFRPCLTHANFVGPEAIERAARLGVPLDVQPAWLYLDSRTLLAKFGADRLRSFQPLASLFAAGAIVGGGSDHMQKIGADRAVNPYNPFLGMWIAITRKAKWLDEPLHSEAALTRQQAIQMYTRNNAYILFLDDRVGALEKGKRADFVILDRDLLECPEDEIKEIRPVMTFLDGSVAFERDSTTP